MSKATESELEALHATVAKVLREQLEGTTVFIMDAEGETKEVSLATPAMVAQAIKFLKDNKITATPEAGDDLDQLAELLKNKPKRGSLRAVPNPKTAAGEE